MSREMSKKIEKAFEKEILRSFMEIHDRSLDDGDIADFLYDCHEEFVEYRKWYLKVMA